MKITQIVLMVLLLSLLVFLGVFLMNKEEDVRISNTDDLLLVPLNNHKETYLVNEKKEIVHIWEHNSFPGKGSYLLEDGTLIRSGMLPKHDNFKQARGEGGTIQKIDWDGNILWTFELSNEDEVLHHDFEVLPNGNILALVWESILVEEAIENGKNPSFFLPETKFIWSEKVIEINAKGDVVWEWRAWDHIVQDFDVTKKNFGVISENPDKIDLNKGWKKRSPFYQYDWIHVNSIDYHEQLDQILLSASNFGEFWIIERRPEKKQLLRIGKKTEERKTGIVYRWGNPQMYERGTSNDQKLFFQHDVEWIPEGHPGADNILIFNNGSVIDRPYSTVLEVVPPVNKNGLYDVLPGQPMSAEVVWEYQAPTSTDFFSRIQSGSQRLPNGNTLITESVGANIFEVTSQGDIVWEYVAYPGHATTTVFRADKYPSYYSAFEGKNLVDVVEPNTTK